MCVYAYVKSKKHVYMGGFEVKIPRMGIFMIIMCIHLNIKYPSGTGLRTEISTEQLHRSVADARIADGGDFISLIFGNGPKAWKGQGCSTGTYTWTDRRTEVIL